MTEGSLYIFSSNSDRYFHLFSQGIVFDGVGETGNTEGNLPSKLTYSIRVDQEKSPSTLHLGPR